MTRAPAPRPASAAVVALALGASPLACVHAPPRERPPPRVEIPVRPPNGLPLDDSRESPPPSDPARPFPFPTPSRDRLANGLALAGVTAPAGAPIELRLVLRGAGSAAEGERTGSAALTALLAKDGGTARFGGRELAERAARLGGGLRASVGQDATTFSLAAPADRLGEALDLLASIAREARLDEGEFRKLRKRERSLRAQAAKTDGAWAARALAHRELYRLPVSLHPYGSPEPTAAELDRLGIADLRAFYKRAYTPQGASLVAVGPLDAATLRAAAEKAFSPWKGPEPPATATSAPTPEGPARSYVADRPGAPSAQIVVAALVGDAGDAPWAPIAVGLLGTGPSPGRLAEALRQRNLAAEAAAELWPVAHGPRALALRATAPAAQAAATALALADVLRSFEKSPPSADELAAARRNALGAYERACATPAGLATLLAELEALGEEEDFLGTLPARLQAVDAAALAPGLVALARSSVAVALSADAAQSAAPLSALGEVHVVSAERGFERVRSVPASGRPAGPERAP
ncbi:MAG TPA: insulinase family protein [Polyangiaceae bacterium]|nr:insulinase family protein [Polyangiaceae bacterium]